MNTKPSEGIYYIVRYPKGWELLTYRFQDREEIDHSEWWEREVASLVASAWQFPSLKKIRLLTYAFPRGRISKPGKIYQVLFGEDFMPATQRLKSEIISAFGIADKFIWTFDEHERCQELDRDEMRTLIAIKETWAAV